MFSKNTVSAIIGDFEKKVVQLNNLAASLNEKAKANREQVHTLELESQKLDKEQARAYVVAGKIKDLVGA